MIPPSLSLFLSPVAAEPLLGLHVIAPGADLVTQYD